MASFQSRSNSFPSQSHPAINDVENHLNKLRKASRATSTSSICASLASLRDLHDGINSIVRMPSIRQAIAHGQGETWMNELLEESLGLVDLCGFTRDILQLTKESIQELESSVRRNKVETTASSGGVNSYVASRKKINKMVGKRLKNITSNAYNQNPTALPHIGIILNEAESLDLSIMKSLLIFLSGEKERSSGRGWPLLSNFTQRRRVSEVKKESRFEDLCLLNIHNSTKNVDAKSMLVQLKTSEMSIHNIEEGLEALFRSLVKTRVALLNALSHN